MAHSIGLISVSQYISAVDGSILTCVDPGELLEEHGDRSNYDSLEHSPSSEQRSNGDKLQFQGVPSGWLR